MSQETNKRPTKNERRDAAREQARQAREAEQRREKRGEETRACYCFVVHVQHPFKAI